MKALNLDQKVLFHPILRRLHPAKRWVFLTLLFLLRESPEGRLSLGNGEAIEDRDLADQAGVPLEEARDSLQSFLELGILEEGEGGLFLSREWLPSPSSSRERVRRHRLKSKTKGSPLQESVTSPLHQNVTSALHQSVTSALHPDEKPHGAHPTCGSGEEDLQKIGAISPQKEGGSREDLSPEKGFFLDPSISFKEKEERSKEEREGECLSPEENTPSPEREKEEESREGGKEETPLHPEGLPHPPSGGQPPPKRASPEWEGGQREEGAQGGGNGDPSEKKAFKSPEGSPFPPEANSEKREQGRKPTSKKWAGAAFQGREEGLQFPDFALEEQGTLRGKKIPPRSLRSPPLEEIELPRKREPFSYPEEFEAFWAVYPRRLEKRRAFRAFRARLREGETPERLIRCAENYRAYVKARGIEERFVKHPATFLGPDRPFEDWEKGGAIPGSGPRGNLQGGSQGFKENGEEDLNLLSL